MTATIKTMEVTVERIIPASPAEVFDAWMDPKSPGGPWHTGRTLIFNPKVDGLFYWGSPTDSGEKPHYGRFTAIERAKRVEHTWMSEHTLGLESKVTLTFAALGDNTRVTLRHTGLPDDERGRGHERGWNHFLGLLASRFSTAA